MDPEGLPGSLFFFVPSNSTFNPYNKVLNIAGGCIERPLHPSRFYPIRAEEGLPIQCRLYPRIFLLFGVEACTLDLHILTNMKLATSTKACWGNKEVAQMARHKAILLLSNNPTKFMNQPKTNPTSDGWRGQFAILLGFFFF